MVQWGKLGISLSAYEYDFFALIFVCLLVITRLNQQSSLQLKEERGTKKKEAGFQVQTSVYVLTVFVLFHVSHCHGLHHIIYRGLVKHAAVKKN